MSILFQKFLDTLEEDEDTFILIDNELFMYELQDDKIEFSSFENEKNFIVNNKDFENWISTKQVSTIIIQEEELENYLNSEEDTGDFRFSQLPMEFKKEVAIEPIEVTYLPEEIEPEIEDIQEIDLQNILKLNTIIQERILNEWERVYSDIEYIDSIENSLKKLYPTLASYESFKKSSNLLKLIYNTTNITDNKYANYLSTQDIIVPENEGFTDKYKYIRKNLHILQGRSFSPFDFSKNPELLIFNINNKEIILNINIKIDTIDAFSVFLNKHKIFSEVSNGAIKIIYPPNTIVNLSEKSGIHVIALFGKLYTYKPVLNQIFLNNFYNSYITPIVSDKKKFYSDSTSDEHFVPLSHELELVDEKFPFLEYLKRENITAHRYEKYQDFDYVIEKPYQYEIPNSNYFQVNHILYDIRGLRYTPQYLADNEIKESNRYDYRYIEGTKLQILDDLNLDMDIKKSSSQICNGLQPDKTYDCVTMNKPFNDSPYYVTTPDTEIMNIIGFYIPDKTEFLPNFYAPSIVSHQKNRPINDVIRGQYDTQSKLKYRHSLPVKNIGYSLLEQVLIDKKTKTRAMKKRKYEFYNPTTQSGIVLFNQDQKKLLQVNEYIDFLNNYLPSIYNIFTQDNFQNCFNVTDINKVLQKYNLSVKDINITNIHLLKNILVINKASALRQKNFYQQEKNYFKANQSKIANFDFMIDKKIFYSLSKQKSSDIVVQQLEEVFSKTITLDELNNHIVKLGYTTDYFNQSYKDKISILYTEKAKKIGTILANEIFYLYINNFDKTKRENKKKRLIEIFTLYEIDIEDIKKQNTLLQNNLSDYDVFKNKLIHLLGQTFDGGQLFYKYIENGLLNNQLKYYKSFSESDIESKKQKLITERNNFRQQFENDKEMYKEFIEKCASFKIKKIYGKKEDLIYDSSLVNIYVDNKYDTLYNNYKIYQGLDDKSTFREVLQKIYLFATEEEIDKYIEKLQNCEECHEKIQNEDYALLINMNSRLNLGTSVSYKENMYTVISINVDGTYVLQNTTEPTDIVFNVSKKNIDDYDKLVTATSNVKRILYQRKNYIWVPVPREIIENHNKCILNDLEINLLQKDWNQVMEMFSEDKIVSEKCITGDITETGCTPQKLRNYVFYIESLSDEIKELDQISIDKEQIKDKITDNDKYIKKNIKLYKKQKLLKQHTMLYGDFTSKITNTFYRISYETSSEKWNDIIIFSINGIFSRKEQSTTKGQWKVIKNKLYLNWFDFPSQLLTTSDNGKTFVGTQGYKVELELVESTEVAEWFLNHNSQLIKMKKMYHDIFTIEDESQKLTELQNLIDKYGRLPTSREDVNFVYWKNSKEKCCCVHHLDLINMKDMDNKHTVYEEFIQKYTIYTDSEGVTKEYSDDKGKYCKFCSEKLDELDDVNYINPGDIERDIVEYQEIYSKKEQEMYNIIQGYIHLYFGPDFFDILKHDDLQLMIQQFIDNEETSLIDSSDIDYTTFLMTFTRNKTKQRFIKEILNKIKTSKSAQKATKLTIPSDISFDKFYTIIMNTFSEILTINPEYLNKTKIKDSISQLENNSDKYNEYFVYTLFQIIIKHKSYASEINKYKKESLSIRLLEKNQSIQLSIIILVLSTSIPDYKTRNLKYQYPLDISNISNLVGYINQRKTIIDVADLERLKPGFSEKIQNKLEYEAIKQENLLFNSQWKEFKPRLQLSSTTESFKELKYSIYDFYPGTATRDPTITTDTSIVKYITTPLPNNFSLLDYMYEETDIHQQFKNINMILITQDFSDNPTLIGQKRYFQTIKDEDLFLKSEIDSEITDEDVRKLQLKEKLDRKYKENLQSSLTESEYENFLQTKLQLLSPPFNGTYTIDVISKQYKHDIINKINELLESDIDIVQKNSEYKKLNYTPNSELPMFQINEVSSTYQETIYENLRPIFNLTQSYTPTIFENLIEEYHVPELRLNLIDYLDESLYLDDIEVKLNSEHYILDSPEYINEKNLLLKSYKEINKFKNKKTLINSIEYILKMLYLFNARTPDEQDDKPRGIIYDIYSYHRVKQNLRNPEGAYWNYTHYLNPISKLVQIKQYQGIPKASEISSLQKDPSVIGYMYPTISNREFEENNDFDIRDYHCEKLLEIISLLKTVNDNADIDILQFLLVALLDKIDDTYQELKKKIIHDVNKHFEYLNTSFSMLNEAFLAEKVRINNLRFERLKRIDKVENDNNDRITREAYRSLNLGNLYDQNHPDIQTDFGQTEDMDGPIQTESTLFNDEIDELDYGNNFENDGGDI